MHYQKKGLKVRDLARKSAAFNAGLRPGDYIIKVNGVTIGDELDFRFYSAQEYLEIEIQRNGKTGFIDFEREFGSALEIEFYEEPINKCTNHCVFCFIDQMPSGLRSGLYIKDEDFKHSFFNGNYVTLSGASSNDLEKVVSIGLSPLFISVHATDLAIRRKMLGNRFAPDVLDQLKFLSKNGISFHTQIVLCPGLNDGNVLSKTIKDLFKFGDNLLSIAVVPVGLTRFRKIPLKPVDELIAATICKQIGELSDRYAKADGQRKLFLADEFFIKSNSAMPPTSYYEDYPQIENGVGLIRQLLDEWKLLKRELQNKSFREPKSQYLLMTSVSAYAYVQKIVTSMTACSEDSPVLVVPVENNFFGNSVTVAGLLTASDIIKKARQVFREKDSLLKVLLPKVMFNYAGFTLDGYSQKRIASELGVSVETPQSLRELMEKLWNVPNLKGKKIKSK